ncbi:HlyD family efflux transporter periplasmic adaptor subunit [Aurantimicrobium minutum]|uniref:HlyD family efflux transporter periplasmic adaptor subunit n=1 Tax=Aurantimicrobium minutum TaxID=708131 RepID=UPI00247317A2|nr:HlyD family efflux transporter periplasmic adaptor subunit [Aurantimicrobium minutum]MDH6423398.1 multidrug efflux pump subunit AcrA (membrane-fusion protein) [Aurantimicrobium minutum]
MFRNRAIAKEPSGDVDRPFRLVTTPARFGLIVAVVAAVCGLLWLFGGQLAVKAPAMGVMVNPPGNVEVYSTVEGTISKDILPTGTSVSEGDVVATVQTPEGVDVPITSPINGTVMSLSTSSYALIGAGAPVMTIAHNTEPMVGLLFVPVAAMGDVVPGLKVEVSPTTTDLTQAGYIVGKIVKVDALPATAERLQLILGDTGLAQELMATGPVQEIYVELETDPNGAYGLKWSGGGPKDADDVSSGTVVDAKIVLRNQTPWQAFTGN